MTDLEARSHRLDAFPAAAVRFSRALDRNRERIAEEEGLSASELRALFYIGEHISVTPKQLAEHMHVTTAAITFISRRLVEGDLLHRVDHPDDRRSIFLELTPRAHAVMERIHADFNTMVSSATAHLDPSQVEEFTGYLSSVAAAIAEHTALIARARTSEDF
ncbi:MarR family winged helix-turn-helix transcriptional regulator [Microbacterium rhizomatis]|uniref:MarR family transcriptional regulator n=1 Tax=Microbacterium rhizomatis TaxID=1631477 RepID=A0A5J5J602_9MICO|nr:MarR family transcriptional regulator [Microbacterium rhizomatis]KAA9111500.1 MarR family transcriptional regulator [Microbacterium rhizomatis]